MKNLCLFFIVAFLSFFSINSLANVGALDDLNCDGIKKSSGQSESWTDGNNIATHIATLSPGVSVDDTKNRQGSRSSVERKNRRSGKGAGSNRGSQQ